MNQQKNEKQKSPLVVIKKMCRYSSFWLSVDGKSLAIMVDFQIKKALNLLGVAIILRILWPIGLDTALIGQVFAALSEALEKKINKQEPFDDDYIIIFLFDDSFVQHWCAKIEGEPRKTGKGTEVTVSMKKVALKRPSTQIQHKLLNGRLMKKLLNYLIQSNLYNIQNFLELVDVGAKKFIEFTKAKYLPYISRTTDADEVDNRKCYLYTLMTEEKYTECMRLK